MDRGLHIRLLGPVSVTWAGLDIELRGQLQRALVAALASEAGKVIPAERLIETIWDHRPPHAARIKLQGLVSTLRKTLAASVPGPARHRWPLVTREPGYLFSLDGVQVDLLEYQGLLKRATREMESGLVSAASACLGEALCMWSGPALADVRSPVLTGLAAGLEQGRLLTIERKADCDLWLGRYDVVAETLTPMLTAHPLREGARATLMLALYHLGARAEALELYRTGRMLLQEQVGIEPGRLLRRLHQLMLADASELATRNILTVLDEAI